MRLGILLGVLLTSCTGDIGGDDDRPPGAMTPRDEPRPPGEPDRSPAPPGAVPPPNMGPAPPASAGARPVLRLTKFQLNNTLRDLLGDSTGAASALLLEDVGAHGFEVAPGVSAAEATILQELAERVAADAVKARLASLVPCVPAAGDDACARKFITTFGRRAWRRPLTTGEAAALEALYVDARKTQGLDFAQGIRVLLTAFLQAPDFLYHLEGLAGPVTKEGPLVALSPWELASRLSYFLAGTMPDDELFAAAESGALATPQGLAAQVSRLLDRPGARATVAELARQWLGLSRVDKLAKDPAIKEWTPAVRAGLVQETRRFVEHVVFEADGRPETLLTAPFSFLNDALAPLYGVSVAHKDLQKVALDPAERVGLLGQGSFLAAQAGPAETSPVKRGHFVLTQLLCRHLPPPPENVPPLPPTSAQIRTVRQRTEQHATDPACAGCHSAIDPLGLAFETYDAVGRYRTMEKTDRIDASGKVTLDGQTRAFANGVELARALAAAAEVRACVGKQVMRYALDRLETDADAAALSAAAAALEKGGIRALLATAPTTRSFTHRLPAAGEVLP